MAGDTRDENSAAKQRRGTPAGRTGVTSPGLGGKPVEMQSGSNETERKNPVEAGPGKIVFYLLRVRTRFSSISQ
jgi:hypothetical protein